jgi:hypothetical protein
MTTEDTENTERENDLQCELAAWELLREAKRELAEAREQNAKLRDIAERAIDDLRWFYEGKSDSLVYELDKLKEGAK